MRTQARQALLEAVHDTKRSAGGISGPFRHLAANTSGLGARADGIFNRYIVYGSNQLPWIHGALGGVTTLADAAWEMRGPDMGFALLHLSGSRLQAAMSGVILLAAWLDFLNLADAILRQCPFYSVETLYTDMHRVQQLLEPSMRALASLEPGQVRGETAPVPWTPKMC